MRLTGKYGKKKGQVKFDQARLFGFFYGRNSEPLINRRRLPLSNYILINRLQTIKEIPLNICNGF